MLTAPRDREDTPESPLDALRQPQERSTKLVTTAVVICLAVTLILLPVQRFTLPFNTALVDLWNVIALPILWFYLLLTKQTMRLPFIAAFWLILLSSLIATLGASSPGTSLEIIAKEVYLYVWFITLVAVFLTLDAHVLRRILLIWLVLVVLNGVVNVIQFLSPDILRSTTAYVEDYGALGTHRPIGLFKNANASASFQLIGFVPLMLVGFSRKVTLILGVFLLFSIIATGSLGASAGFLSGLMISALAILAISIVSGRTATVAKAVALGATGALLFGVVFTVVFAQHPDFSDRLDYIFLGRVERSSETRFVLWEQVKDFLIDRVPIWGIGPGNFKDELLGGKSAHNDLLAFSVERGVLGAMGLVFFGAAIMGKAIHLLLNYTSETNQNGLSVVIFLAIAIAVIVNSQTHQVFHSRSLWLAIALLEVVVSQLGAYKERIEQPLLGVTRNLVSSRPPGAWHGVRNPLV